MSHLIFTRTGLFTLIGLLFLAASCYGYPLLEKEGFNLYLDAYLRNDLVSFKNIADLDSHNSDDTSTYFGIDYSLALRLEAKQEGPSFYIKLERNGPYDYDAPLFTHNTLINTGGFIQDYRNEELLPGIEEFWLDVPLDNGARFKSGLYIHEVGNGFALNGAYENYGFTVYNESEDFSWRFYYSRPDFSLKNRLGPDIPQDNEQGIDYESNVANFFAADFKYNRRSAVIQPYIGILTDNTSAGKRDNAFTAPVKREILGTFGIALDYNLDSVSYAVEMAHNFGRAESSDPLFKDVYHTGYLFYGSAKRTKGRLRPSLQFLLCSGNEVSEDAALNQDSTLSSGKNRAFSYFSPLNKNLGDSVNTSNVDMLPIVSMGGGWGLNYGIPRPGTFSPGDFENLIMPSVGFDFDLTDRLCLGFYAYYLRSFERGVGALAGEPRRLAAELGAETDLFIDYTVNENIAVSILAGFFYPGKYYRQERDDAEGSLFSPFVRGDGEVDTAYQIELAMEFKF